MVAVRGSTTEVASKPNEIDVALHQFAANLVDSPVGISREQNCCRGMQQMLLQHVEHAIRGLARAGRPYNEIEVLSLKSMQNEVVKRRRCRTLTIVAHKLQRRVHDGFALSEHHLPTLLWSAEKSMQGAIEGRVGRLHEIVLHGPPHTLVVIAFKHLGVLRVTKAQEELVSPYVGDRTAEDERGGGIGFIAMPVRIKHHDVAHTKVGHVGIVAAVKPEHNVFLFVTRLHVLHLEPFIDVARQALVSHRRVPDRGKTRIFLRPATHLREHVLGSHEAHEAQIVSTFHGVCLPNGCKQRLDGRLVVTLPQRGVTGRENAVGGERGEHIHAVLRIPPFAPRYLVAHAHSLKQQLGSGTELHQPRRIFGIEQIRCHSAIFSLAISIMEHGAVEQQLHIVFLLLSHIGVGRPVSRLAALLLHHRVERHMNEVHTSLKAKRLTEERGFKYQFARLHRPLFLLVLQRVGHDVANVGALALRLTVEVGIKLIRATGKGQGVSAEEMFQAVSISGVGIIDRLVEQLTGIVAKQDGLACRSGLELVHQAQTCRAAILLKTGCHSRYVYQVVGVEHKQLAIQTSLFLARLHDVELRPLIKKSREVTPVAHAVFVLLHIDHLHILARVASRGKDGGVVPPFNGAAQHGKRLALSIFQATAPGVERLALIMAFQLLRHGGAAIDHAHKLAHRLQVARKGCFELSVAGGLNVPQAVARVVDGLHKGVVLRVFAYAALANEILYFRIQPRKAHLHALKSLVHSQAQHAPEHSIAFAHLHASVDSC